MRTPFVTLLLLFLLAAACADATQARQSAAAQEDPVMVSDSAAVADVIERFHGALAAGDSMAVLAMLTADAVVLENGETESKEEYRSHHLAADIAFARAVPSERGPLRVVVRDGVAWVTSTSTTRGEFRGRQIDAQGAELMVLERTPEGWRIAAIHWSSRNLR